MIRNSDTKFHKLASFQLSWMCAWIQITSLKRKEQQNCEMCSLMNFPNIGPQKPALNEIDACMLNEILSSNTESHLSRSPPTSNMLGIFLSKCVLLETKIVEKETSG